MSTSNPIKGVGGTAKDGGVSTAATVADGGPNDQAPETAYVPPDNQKIPEKPVTRSQTGAAKTSNPIDGVGGTAQDGGVSTAATVADGGPNAKKEDPTYQPPS